MGKKWKWWSTLAHRSILWTNAPTGSYTNGRYQKPTSAEFSPTDHPHLYLFLELLRTKYSLTPTAHGRPCIPAKALQEISWVLTMLQNLACSRSSTKSNLTRPVSSHSLLRDLESLFGGISKVKGKVIKLHIDPDVISKQQPHRRISFQVRKDVEMELKRLEELDIIETVTGPTPWVSLIVIVPKRSGQVRICVDMRETNKAVKHLMPTIDDLVADLNRATVFSKLDLSSGYHQLELAPESRCITTFSTHVGLRRYKRLMFGINAAPEILQNAIEEILTGLPGCKNISDDITVYGKTQKKHDENLRGVLKRLQQHGLNNKYAPSRGVRSSSTDRFSARTESRQTQREDQGDMDMSKPESVSEVVSTGDGSLHPRLGHDNCSFTAVNQKRHVMAVGRRTATSIRQVER